MARALAALALLALLAPPASAQLPLPPNPLAGEVLVHRNADVEAKLRAWAEEFPDFVAVEAAGSSTLGQAVWAVTLQAPNATAPWRVYLDGGHHGNEYFGTEFVMAYLTLLVAGYRAQDAAVLGFLQGHAVKAVPIVNPDGNLLDTRKNPRQVDLNRNYPFQWGGEGSGASPSDGNYRGEAPASEAETQANIAAQQAWQPHVLVTMHTGIAEMYWPWSYSADASPDEALWNSLEAPFEAASNGRLDAMQGAELYLTAGSSDDYAYATFGIPAFTIEVHEDQTTPAYPGGIGPEMRDQLAGLAWLLERTGRLGALLAVQDFRVEGGTVTVVLNNTGLGDATNATLTLLRGADPLVTSVVSVPAGSQVTASFPAPGGAQNLRLEGRYARLLINTSQVLDLTATPTFIDEGSGPARPAPGLEAALGCAALAGLALGLRRRRA